MASERRAACIDSQRCAWACMCERSVGQRVLAPRKVTMFVDLKSDTEKRGFAARGRGEPSREVSRVHRRQ